MLRSLLVFALTLGATTSAFAIDKAYYQLSKVTVTEIADDASADNSWAKRQVLPENCASQLPLKPVRSNEPRLSNPAEALNVVEVVVDQIINIGKKIFAVIDAGRPVVNIKLDTANALPAGVTCWSDLSGWSMPKSKVYNVVYENGLGMSVVDFTYRVIFTSGGSVDGTGKYITNATFLPANLSVAWGFKFDAKGAIPSVFNMGSRQTPVAGMQMNLEWKVTSPVAHEQAVESFHVSGMNELVHLD